MLDLSSSRTACHSGWVQPIVHVGKCFASHGLHLQGGATPCSHTAATDATRACLCTSSWAGMPRDSGLGEGCLLVCCRRWMVSSHLQITKSSNAWLWPGLAGSCLAMRPDVLSVCPASLVSGAHRLNTMLLLLAPQLTHESYPCGRYPHSICVTVPSGCQPLFVVRGYYGGLACMCQCRCARMYNKVATVTM